MRYCVTNSQRVGGCYIEFYAGKYDGTQWHDESLNIHYDVFCEYDLHAVFVKALPRFDHCGVTEISLKSWAEILNGEATALQREILCEMDQWVKTRVAGESFTVLGV